MERPEKYAPPYRHVARVYDALASAYSLGAIDRAKRFHHGLIQPGHRVLYAGAGRGQEIVEAVKRGAEATCVEPCPAMALRLHDRLARHGERFTIVPRPIQAVTPLPEYELVVAHFFLNVFNEEAMQAILHQLCGFVKPGGRIVIADFKPNSQHDGWLTRLLRWAYYRPLNVAGGALRICSIHPIYDYARLLARHELTVDHHRSFRVLPGAPSLYEALSAQRVTCNTPHQKQARSI